MKLHINATLMIAFLLMSSVGHSQLLDPFGKIIVHEIKMNKLDDGTYRGAIEWTTGGIDSLQKFIINGLDINAPVMVRLISKAPDHNIDLSFHKKGWDKIESKVSTNGDKFVTKVFRTMNTAGLGVSSEVAGIPYLITVKVGLQFPSTKNLIQVTDDKELFTRHVRKMGYSGEIFTESNTKSTMDSDAISNSEDSNFLTYIIIGLLSIIVIVLILFLLKRKSARPTLLLILSLGISQMVLSQNAVPRNVPMSEQSDVFIDYKSRNVSNQSPIPLINPIEREVSAEPGLGVGVFRGKATVRIQYNSGSIEIPRPDAEKVEGRLREEDSEFDSEYQDNVPGESTEGDQRIPPTNINAQELAQLRSQVRRLRSEVERLSQEDRQYEPVDDGGGVIMVYCEDVQACERCLERARRQYATHRAYLEYLQKFYLKKVTDLNDWIDYGNTMSSLPGGGGMAWGPILLHKVRPAMDNLKQAYNKKFDEYIESIEEDLSFVRGCYHTHQEGIRIRDIYADQVVNQVDALRASRINL